MVSDGGEYQDSEVGDFRERLRNDELECNVGEEEDEAELEAVWNEVDVDGKRREDEAADEHLPINTTQTITT